MLEASNGPAPPSVRRALFWLVVATVTQAATTIGHFAHGAHVYDDPSRLHVVAPTVVCVAVVALLAIVAVKRPTPLVLWPLALAVGVPFVAMFGVFHGAFGHGLKLVLFATGTSPERLLEIFDSPDFAAPNDLVFELTGLSTLVVAGVVAHHLGRLLCDARSASAPDVEGA
jgi:hypothetical protein